MMRSALLRRAARVGAAAAAVAATVALGGCSLMTPGLSEVEQRQASPAVSAPVIHEDGVLTVALDSADAPLAMVDGDNLLTGYSVDLAAALADEMGLDVRFVSASAATDGLSEKGADIYLSTASSEASADIDVVGTTMSNATGVFTKAEGDIDASALPSDMASAAVAVQDQSASQDILNRSGIGCQQSTYSNINECFEALDAGEVSYVVCEAVAGEYLARSYDGVKLAGTLDEAQNYGIAVSADNLDLSSAVTDALDSMTADGTLSAVHARWFGDSPLDLSSLQIPGITIQEKETEGGLAEASDQGAEEGDSEGSSSSDASAEEAE